MIYTETVRLAMRICCAAHAGQLDKGGYPYVFHPFHLAEQMESEDAVVAALLHDVIEDTDFTPERLAALGIPAHILSSLRLLTHDADTPYMEYVAALKIDPVARAVKLADLRHNSDLSRLKTVGEKDRARAAKYRAAIALLEE